jgi:hypothetical protein
VQLSQKKGVRKFDGHPLRAVIRSTWSVFPENSNWKRRFGQFVIHPFLF